jgi:shikimate dehydrogenase
MISGKAKTAGVMGWPVKHSLSPRLHNYWIKQQGIDGAYIPIPVEPSRLEQALRALPVLGFCGCNLTIPHKETALKIVDHINEQAKRIGAVNTIVVNEKGELEGQNTDAFGFQENMKEMRFNAAKAKKAVILGAGGAARAIIVALQDMGLQEICIVNRTKDKAERCAIDMNKNRKIEVFEWTQTAKAFEGADLLINTTPLGMTGMPPLEIDYTGLPCEAWVTDIVYTPLATAFLKKAREQGYMTIDGLGMLLHQARPGFEAWFGKKAEVTGDLRKFILQND